MFKRMGQLVRSRGAVLGVSAILAAAAVGAAPGVAKADRDHGGDRGRWDHHDWDHRDWDHHDDHGGGRVDIRLGGGPVCVPPPVYVAPPPVQRVWVDPVYTTVTERVWVPAQYRTVVDHVWVDAVTQTVTDRVWVPDQFATQAVERVDPHDGHHYKDHVKVLAVPGHFEDQSRQVVVTPGHYEDRPRQELVCDGHFEDQARQELVSAGHWEVRPVAYVAAPPPVVVVPDRPRVGIDLRIPIGH